MNKMFYPRLALTNIKKNGKTYFPYILTCIGTIMMFYIMHFISVNKGLVSMSGGLQLKQMLFLGTIIVGLFSVIFLFYTNSFLIKRRNKELGLFNILGMEKKHIAKVLFWETILVFLVSIVIGLLGGIVLSKLMFLLLLKLLNFEIPIKFYVSTSSLITTAILFAFIFFLTLIRNLGQVHLSKPIELLKGGQVGEREPKTKWLLTSIGVICLAWGYFIALTTESPLNALSLFFFAVILVIIGTYALFTAGSIAILKILRMKKKFYYQTRHFISVSGMIYRMKQNAVGLANICILSTAVLVMLSTTVSMYIGMENLLRTRYPRDIAVSARNVSDEESKMLDSMILEEAERFNISVSNKVRFRSKSLTVVQDNNLFSDRNPNTVAGMDTCILHLMPLSEYNLIENQSATLDDNEVLLYTFRGKITGDTINILGNQFKIKEHLSNVTIDGKASALLVNTYFIIVPDTDVIEKLSSSSAVAGNNMTDLSYYFAFNAEGNVEDEIALTYSIQNRIRQTSMSGYTEGLEEARESFYSLYGGLFFLGIFLGALFIMA
ncbi:MAG: ABC transporter permease, partial [Clostridiaceae bacterium]|nr:ABC transporter permease [Clostridiaceae bacterium]